MTVAIAVDNEHDNVSCAHPVPATRPRSDDTLTAVVGCGLSVDI